MELSGLYVHPAGHLRPPTEPPVHNLKSPNTNIHIVMKRGVGFQINKGVLQAGVTIYLTTEKNCVLSSLQAEISGEGGGG